MSAEPIAVAERTGHAAPHDATRRRGPVWALLTANAISLTGNRMAGLAIPWFVLETTQSPVRTGVVAFFTLLPTVLAAVIGGTIVDRLGAKRTSIVSDLLSGLTVALVPLLHLAGLLRFEVLLLLVFAGALLDAPGKTARDALLPDLTDLANLRRERANGLYQAVVRLSSLLGPPLAGLLIAATGATGVLWLDAASFGISAALIGLGVPAARPAPRETQPAGGFLAQFREGVTFIWHDRLLRLLALTVAATNLLDAPLGVALPVLARDAYGGAGALGLLFGAMGAGALTGSLLYGAIGHRLPRQATYLTSFVAVSSLFWVLVLTPPLPLTLGAMAVISIASGPINPILMTLLQDRVPSALRGRVFGAFTAMAWCAMPVGVLAGGLLVDLIGATATFAIVGGGYLAVTVTQAFLPAMRSMGETRRREGAPA